MYPTYAWKEVLFHWGAYRATWFHYSLIKHGWINRHITALQKRYLRNTFFLFSYILLYYNLTGCLQRVMFVLSYLIHGDTYALSMKSCKIVRIWSVFEHWPLLSCDFSCPVHNHNFHHISDLYFSTNTQQISFKMLHLYILLVCKITWPKDSRVDVTMHNCQLVK